MECFILNAGVEEPFRFKTSWGRLITRFRTCNVHPPDWVTKWKQERKKQAAQAEAAAALEVEQLRSLYQAEGRISPPEDAVL